MSKKKILFLVFVLLIAILVVGFLIVNNRSKEPTEKLEPKINKEQAIKLLKNQYKDNNNIYKYEEKNGEYYIIKVVNNPSIEYWVHDNTGEIIIQSNISSSNTTNNE